MNKFKNLLLPGIAISMIFVMLVPIPGFVLDVLLAASITASVIVFLTAIQVRKAVDFSVFPTLLLLLTLFRLSLNIASSRRILLHGHEGTHAAGAVIEAFGQFVVGGNYVVGFVLFLALVAIQFLVVAHGAVRTAEVTARFTLDALPGKQMAIDADMNAGLIDQEEARRRREKIAREAEFYGSMDGAAKFNQRDAMATILITAINIVAGIVIGTLQQGVDLLTAVKTYTILTVGDGLVTLIPSLLISIAGGMILTRASSSGQLDTELSEQLLTRRNTLWIACGVLLALALIPGMPKIAFVLLAGGVAFIARKVPAGRQADPSAAKRDDKQGRCTRVPRQRCKEERSGCGRRKPRRPAQDGRIDARDRLSAHPAGGREARRPDAQPRALAAASSRHRTRLRRAAPVHITDNLRLKPREYTVSLRGVEIARWQTEPNCALAVNSDPKARQLPGLAVREPAFGVAARWIQHGLEDQALAAGYSVVDQTTVIGTHLGELIRRHAHELLGRQETKRLLDSMNDAYPKLVEELVPKLLTLGEVQRVLQQLLREQVSIRDLGAILEVLVEAAQQSKNVVHLVESVRQSLGRGLVHPLLDNEGGLRVLMIEPNLEARVGRYVRPAGGLPSGRRHREEPAAKAIICASCWSL